MRSQGTSSVVSGHEGASAIGFDGVSKCSVDGGVRLAGGRVGSDEADVVPYGYAAERSASTLGLNRLPPPYGTML